MEVDVNKEKICINKLVCEKKELFFVEEDVIVPDTKPDILNTINLNGNVCILKKEVMDGKIKLEGSVNTYVMYIPDSKNCNLRGLNTCINFTKMLNIDECREGMIVVSNFNVKDLECKVLNGRKINIRAGIEACIKLYSNEDLDIIDKVNNIDDIQTLEEDFNINSLIGSGTTKIYVKDTLNIEQNDDLEEILKSEINLINNDIKISYNKVLSKCEIDVKIMYLTQDNRIGTVQGKIPAVGFIDMQNISEDSICDMKNEIKNIVIRPNSSEEHSIYIEIELETMCIAYEKKEINIIQDLYSPTIDLGLSQKKIVTSNNKIIKNKNFTVTSKTNIPDIVQGNLLDVEIGTNITKEQITSSKIIYEGELVLNFIFSKENNSVNSKLSKIPFDFFVENPTMEEFINIETTKTILNKNFSVKTNGDIECSIDMEFTTEFYQNISINIIDNIEVQENRDFAGDYDSLIIYIVQPGDTLWKIAKKYKSTVEQISRMNGIENENKIYPGEKIYIPKFNGLDGI